MDINPDLAWLVGIWAADRGSSAKGVVSLKNKSRELLLRFEDVSRSLFGIPWERIRRRVTRGYGEAYEVYYTSMRVRRILEELYANRLMLLVGELGVAYIGGRLDGDGYVSFKKHDVYIGYSAKHMSEAMVDSEVAWKAGLPTSLTSSQGIVKLRILKPRRTASILVHHVYHPEKRRRLLLLSQPDRRGRRGKPSERDPHP